MSGVPETNALLGFLPLGPGQPRVRLRLARPRDWAGIRALCERQGRPLDGLELARLTRFDPRARLVLCASALVDSHEEVVGVGAIDLAADGNDVASELALLEIDPRFGEELRALLREALAERESAGRARRAA